METNTTQTPLFPKPTGDYAVGTTSFYFKDSQREEPFTEDPNDNREITAKIWYPSEKVPGATTAPYMSAELSTALASGLGIPPQDFTHLVQSIPTHSVENAPVAKAESKYPVLFLSHGGGDMPEFSTVRAEELASQGYVVVAINHTYDSALNIFPDGRVIPRSPAFDAASREGSDSEFVQLQAETIVPLRAGDIQFVLDELEKFNVGNDPTGLFNGKLDLERVGVFGISTGGATAAEVLSIDPRFKTGANLDGTLRGDTPDASVSQPYLQFNNVAFGTEISSDEISRELFDRYLNDRESSLFADSSFPLPEAYPEVIAQSYKEENLLSDKDGDDEIYGGQENDTLYGGGGNDLIKGGNGSDALHGGKGDNSLYGENGNDYLYGQDGSDSLYGGEANDFLRGAGGNDVLEGDNGDDTLIGNKGDDTMSGGAANDILSGGAGDDILRDTQGNNILYGDADNDRLYAGEGNDELYGDAGNDILVGESGNASLNGGTGDDLLQGGSGLNKFYLSSNRDIIQNFQDGRDLLGLPIAIDGTPLGFSDLDIVQVGQNTEIRWKLDGMSDAGSQMHVTILEGMQASQITRRSCANNTLNRS